METAMQNTQGLKMKPIPSYAFIQLSRLGIYGWDKIEDLILAAMVTGDSALLTGKHGIAKTYCAQRLAQAMGVKYQKVDASKAEFEDYLGFPNPKALSEGRFEYISTPLSIAGKEFVFLDEINRCRPSTQNKLLELVYERKFFGQDTDVIWLWAAMNTGSEYLAAEGLDPAFLGRFAFIIPVPEATDMSEEDIVRICESETAHDAPALKKNTARPDGEKNHCDDYEFQKFIKKAAATYRYLYKVGDDTLAFAISNVSRLLAKENNIKLDGRRMSMMRRALLAYMAVRLAKGCSDPRDGKGLLLESMQIIPSLIPEIALSDDIGRRQQLISAVNIAFKKMFSSDEFLNAHLEKDIVKKMAALCSHPLPNYARKKILNDVLADDEMKPLIAAALSPFVLMENSLFSTAEAETVMTEVSRLVELNNTEIEIRQLADFNRFSEELRESKTGRVEALCEIYSRDKTKNISSNASRLRQQTELEKKYLDFMNRCLEILKPVYDSEMQKRNRARRKISRQAREATRF